MAAQRGQCLCGAVTFSAENVESDFGACHCRMCQRWSGGVFLVTSVHGLKFDGEEHLSRYQSSSWAERGFCNKCGSNLFYRALQSGEYEMCVGTFDDQSDFNLTTEIFVDRKPAGYSLAGDHPRLTEAETLEKYKEYSE